MSVDIIRLSAGDFDELMMFLNLVFSEHAPHDFANLLPSIYQPTDKLMRCNYAIRDGGRLGAVVGVFPIDWRVGGIPLRVAGIGGVSVHPESRGKGYMKRLMCHAVDEMRREGYDLSYLGGRRQRYAYFGYEVAGTSCRVNYNTDNVRHTSDPSATDLTFEPISDNPTTIAAIRALHDAQPAYCERSVNTFHHYLMNWHCNPFFARDADGLIVGYLSMQREEPVCNEFVAQDARTASAMMRAWIGKHQSKTTAILRLPMTSIHRELHGFAESLHLYHTGNYQVFDWVKTLDALLRLKHATEAMADGRVVIRIGNDNVTLSLTVDGDKACCEATDAEPDLLLDAMQAVRVLFNLAGPTSVIDVPKRATVLTSWCPLPMGFSTQDHV